MKKIISIVLLLAMILGVFAGCGKGNNETKDNPLDSAVAYLKNMYDNSTKDEVNKLTSDKELVPSVTIGGVSYTVTWSINVTSGPADAIVIAAGAATGTQKIDIVTQPEEEVRFTLVGTVSDSEGKTATIEIKFYSPAVQKVEVNEGQRVVIYLVSDGKYMTGIDYLYTSSSGSQKHELELTSDKAEALPLTLQTNEDGTVSFVTDGGLYLFCDATHVMFVEEQSDYTLFILEAAEGGQYIKCAVANYNEKPQYLEVYSGYMTCYGMSESSNLDLYIFELQDAEGANGTVGEVTEACDHDYVDGTCTKCGEADPNYQDPNVTAQLPTVTAPVAGTPYKFGVIQVGVSKVLYVTGEVSGRYLTTTTDKSAAADVYVEEADGGWKFYILVDGAKSYIYIYNNDEGKRSVGYGAEGTVFAFNAECSNWVTTFEGAECYLGAYSTYETISVSETSYINAGNAGISQYPAGFFETEGDDVVVTPEPVPEPEPDDNNDPAANSTLTILEAIALGESKEHNTYTEGKYYVTGVITEVYNTTYGNMKIADAAGNILTIYGTYDADGTNRYDAMATKPVAGDTVTIYGVIGQYNNVAQIKNGWIVAHTPSGNPAPEPEPEPDDNNDPAANSTLTILEAIALGESKEHNTYTEGKYYVTGVITEVYNTTYGNMKIADAAGNILTIYGTYDADGTNRYDAMATKPVAGDTVTIYGVIGQYNNVAQIKNGWIVAHTPSGNPAPEPEPEPDDNNDPAANSTLTILEAIALGESKEHNTYTEGKYYVTGVITEVYNTTYGNMYITDGNGNTLCIYGTYDADGTNRYDAMATKPVVGDTVTIYGVIGQYNGTAQIKNGWIVAHTPSGNPAPEPEPEPSECPLVEGVGYKLTASNANGPLWFNGTVENGRFGATTNEADAVLIYLEQVDGGYLLYFMDGNTKTYIVMDDKAAGGSFTTDAAAASVFEWNGTLNTMVVAEDSNNRAFATDPTKTYENFSCYDSSNTSYDYAEFVADGG